MRVWQHYGKGIIAFLFAVWLSIAPQITGDGRVDVLEGVAIAIGVVNALLVFIVPLNPAWEAGKTVINALLASLTAAQMVMFDGLQTDDWSVIIGAGLALLIGWYAPTVSLPKSTERVRVGPGFNA